MQYTIKEAQALAYQDQAVIEWIDFVLGEAPREAYEDGGGVEKPPTDEIRNALVEIRERHRVRRDQLHENVRRVLHESKLIEY